MKSKKDAIHQLDEASRKYWKRTAKKNPRPDASLAKRTVDDWTDKDKKLAAERR